MPMVGEATTEELWKINAINNDKRNMLLSGKASKRSLIKIGKENDMATRNTLQVKLQRQEKK